MKTITDSKGNVQDIHHGEKYVVIYKDDKKIKLEKGCYYNYDVDEYIGKDDEEGRSYGPRFYFDGAKIPKWAAKREILIIDTMENFYNKLKQIYEF